MPYAIREDLTKRFGNVEIERLEDPDNTTDADEEYSNVALLDAEEEVNTYIGVRYTLPLPRVPEPVKRVTCDIARYRLYKNRPTEEVTLRYEQSIKWLKDVAAGKAVLNFEPVLTEEEVKATQGPAVAIGSEYDGGVFGKATTDKMLKRLH